IRDSRGWEESHRRRRAAYDRRGQGAPLEGENAALVRFTLVDMFAEPAVRMRLLLTFIMSLSVTIGYWGVSTFVPAYVGSVAAAGGPPPPYYAALVGLIQNTRALLGVARFRFFGERRGGRGRGGGRRAAAVLRGAGRVDREHRRAARLCELRLFGRSLRAQADDDTLLSDVPDPLPASLSRDQGRPSPGGRLRGLRIFHPGLLLLDADLAAGALSHAHARDRRRLHLQRAAPHFSDRAADRRHLDREPRRLRQSGDHHRHVLHPRASRRAVPAGDAGQAAAGRRHARAHRGRRGRAAPG